jgi:hypothetical protein
MLADKFSIRSKPKVYPLVVGSQTFLFFVPNPNYFVNVVAGD